MAEAGRYTMADISTLGASITTSPTISSSGCAVFSGTVAAPSFETLKPTVYLIEYEFKILNLSVVYTSLKDTIRSVSVKGGSEVLFEARSTIQLTSKKILKEELMIRYAKTIGEFNDSNLHIHVKELNRWIMED